MNTVTCTARRYGGAYLARAGFGRRAKNASCTADVITAVQRAAARYFGRAERNGATAADIVVKECGQVYFATLPTNKGGAS